MGAYIDRCITPWSEIVLSRPGLTRPGLSRPVYLEMLHIRVLSLERSATVAHVAHKRSEPRVNEHVPAKVVCPFKRFATLGTSEGPADVCADSFNPPSASNALEFLCCMQGKINKR